MKRIVGIFVGAIFSIPVMASDIYIPTEIVGTVLMEHFGDNAATAATAYHEMLTGGAGVTVDGLYRVCVAGGMDIKTTDGKNKCEKFASELMKTASLDFYAVCGDDKGKTGGTEECIEGVFENGWSKLGDGYDLNTGVMQARAFASAYIKHKHNVDTFCSKDYRSGGNDEFIKCTSLDNKNFYEVRFDNVTESSDYDSEKDQKYAICYVYGFDRTPDCDGACDRGCVAKQASDCNVMRELANKLAYDVEFGAKTVLRPTGNTATPMAAHQEIETTACWFKNRASQYTAPDGGTVEDTFAKIDGLNNRHFYGIHSLNTNLHDSVRQYVHTVIPGAVVECNDNTTKIANVNGNMDKDEVLRCTVNGAPIDFVFDDTSEFMKYERRAGESALGCAALGGTYTGKGCINVGEKECMELIANLNRTCPSCSKPVWESENNRCFLPDSDAADKINFGAKIGGLATLTIGSVVLTIFSGGTTGMMTVALIGELIGGVMEITGEIMIGTDAARFLEQTAKCGGTDCGGCAERILSQLHTHVAQSTDYQAIEIEAIDTEMARLLTCLPENSELSEKIMNGILAENEGITGEWSDAQILRAAGGVLGLSSLFMGIGRTAVVSAQRGSGFFRTARALNRYDDIMRARKLATGAKAVKAATNVDVSKMKQIALLDERYLSRIDDVDAYIIQLESQGYRIEQIGARTGIGWKGTKTYRQFAVYKDTDDIEAAQKAFLAAAGDKTDAAYRRTFITNVYTRDMKNNPDSWMNTYDELVTGYLANDADVIAARKNWSRMSDTEKQTFIAQTNDKIRGLITENVPDAEIRIMNGDNVAGASFDPVRLETGADVTIDRYNYSTEESFDNILESLIHENKHFGQDVGKSDLPRWLLADNIMDGNYWMPESRNMLPDELYLWQPVEAEVNNPIRHGTKRKLLNDLDNPTPATSDEEFLAHLEKYGVTDDGSATGTSTIVYEFSDAARLAKSANFDDSYDALKHTIGDPNFGWQKVYIDGVPFRIKQTITTHEWSVTQDILEMESMYSELSWLGEVNVNGKPHMVLTYKSNLAKAKPLLDKRNNGFKKGVWNRVFDYGNDHATHMRDVIGSSSDGWKHAIIDGNNRFLVKKYSSAEEVENVKQILQNSPDEFEVVFLGVDGDNMVLTYKGDVNSAKPVFEKHIAAQSTANKLKKWQDELQVLRDKFYSTVTEAEMDEFSRAHQMYAPSNQSFDDFAKMWDYDIDKMRQGTSTMLPTNKNALNDMYYDLIRQRTALSQKYNNPYIPSAKEQEEWAAFAKAYPDLAENESKMRAIRSFNIADGNYSTVDMKAIQISKEFDAQKAAVKTKEELIDLKAKTINKSADLIQKWDVQPIAEKHREMYLSIIGRNKELKSMAMRFDTLTDSEKATFGQKIMNEVSRQECRGGSCKFNLRSITEDGVDALDNGWYSRRNGINLVKENGLTLDEFISTLAHETSHWFDDLFPNKGALGAQKANLASKIYQNSSTVSYATYRNTLDEQSAFQIGNFVGDGFTSELIRRFGTN